MVNKDIQLAVLRNTLENALSLIDSLSAETALPRARVARAESVSTNTRSEESRRTQSQKMLEYWAKKKAAAKKKAKP